MSQQTVLHVEIVTPEGPAYTGSAQAVSLPGGLAPFQVLVNHAPIISTLELGVIKVLDMEGDEHLFVVTSGFVEVKNNRVSIVAEEVHPAASIDVERARAESESLRAALEQETDLQRRAQLKAQLARAELLAKVGQGLLAQ